MKEKRKKEIKEMASAIDNTTGTTGPHCDIANDHYTPSSVSPEIERKMITPAEKIIATKNLEIPKCLSTPVNGRIYIIDVASSELRSPGGLILPQKYAAKKNDELVDIKRYFVVAWDKDEIPPSIQDKLEVGIEINPFYPENAEEWNLPRVIDWQTGNIFKFVHYTELAGISSVKPEIVE